MAARGPIETMDYTPQLDYTDDVYARVAAVGESRLAEANALTAKAERAAAIDAATEADQGRAVRGVPRARAARSRPRCAP